MRRGSQGKEGEGKRKEGAGEYTATTDGKRVKEEDENQTIATTRMQRTSLSFRNGCNEKLKRDRKRKKEREKESKEDQKNQSKPCVRERDRKRESERTNLKLPTKK